MWQLFSKTCSFFYVTENSINLPTLKKTTGFIKSKSCCCDGNVIILLKQDAKK